MVRALLVGCCFLGLLALSARLIAVPLSDGMERHPTVLAFGGGSDRSVFAPAAYGEDSQTAVDDDEDIFQSIKTIANKGKHQGLDQAHAPKVQRFRQDFIPQIALSVDKKLHP